MIRKEMFAFRIVTDRLELHVELIFQMFSRLDFDSSMSWCGVAYDYVLHTTLRRKNSPGARRMTMWAAWNLLPVDGCLHQRDTNLDQCTAMSLTSASLGSAAIIHPH